MTLPQGIQFTQREGFDLHPVAVLALHERAIDAHHLAVHSRVGRRALVLEPCQRCRLGLQAAFPGALRQPPRGLFTHGHVVMKRHLRTGLLKRHLDPQSHHAFMQPRRPLPRRQLQLLIQGEKP